LTHASHPFRALVQIPEALARAPACLLVAPASGSRGVYGAIQLAGPMGLPRGCAVVYTDKGAGTDHQTFDDQRVTNLAGQRRESGDVTAAFELQYQLGGSNVGIKHLHSGDHPEADWGLHVLAAARFGIEQLRRVIGDEVPIRVLAVGLSNGGGAVLRAAEMDQSSLLDGVVAVMPNVTVRGQPPLYDYATLAALYQPCLLANTERTLAMPLGNPLLIMRGQQRCQTLVDKGLLPEATADAALAVLAKAGFGNEALRLSASNIALDLWRMVASAYASAYLRRGPGDMPCGFSLSAEQADTGLRSAWWATHSGVGPGAGITLVDSLADGDDGPVPGLLCLRKLWEGEGSDNDALRSAVASTQARGDLPAIPVVVIHGRDDGLIPAAFTSRPYVEAARLSGAEMVSYWEIERAQHFDAFLNVPGLADQLVPILPYGWMAFERLWGYLDQTRPLPKDWYFSPEPGSRALTPKMMGFED